MVTFGFSINRPGDTLTFDLLTSNLVRVIAREVGNLLNNFDVLGLGTCISLIISRYRNPSDCIL